MWALFAGLGIPVSTLSNALSVGVALLTEAPRPAQGALNDAMQRLPGQMVRDLETGLGQLVGGMRIKDQKAAMQPLSDP